MLLYLEDKFYRSCKRVQYTYFIEYLSSFTTLSFPTFFSFSKTVKKMCKAADVINSTHRGYEILEVHQKLREY